MALVQPVAPVGELKALSQGLDWLQARRGSPRQELVMETPMAQGRGRVGWVQSAARPLLAQGEARPSGLG